MIILYVGATSRCRYNKYIYSIHEPIPISGMRTSLLIFEPPYEKPLTPIKNILAINPLSYSAPRRDDLGLCLSAVVGI